MSALTPRQIAAVADAMQQLTCARPDRICEAIVAMQLELLHDKISRQVYNIILPKPDLPEEAPRKKAIA